MLVREAEERFRKGLSRLERGQILDALPFIKAAVEAQQQADPRGYSQATYLSYRGLCTCLTRSGMHQGLADCRQASRMDPHNPNVWCNLGRVALMVGLRAEAHRAFQRGLEVEPGHSGIMRLLQKTGIRRRPVVTSLSRKHPVNVILGKLRPRSVASGSTRDEFSESTERPESVIIDGDRHAVGRHRTRAHEKVPA